MAEWDVIECDFNTADETINFGSRKFADGDNLFEACTLAAIKNSDGNVTASDLNLHACINNSKVFFSINKSLKVFTNTQCNEICFNTVFDDEIDTFCITSDGRFMFICLRGGACHCIDIQNENEVISSGIIADNNWLDCKFFIRCYVETYRSDYMSYLTVDKKGNIYRAAVNLTRDDLPKAIDSESTDKDVAVFDSHLLVNLDRAVKNAAFNYPVLFVNGEKMSTYNTITEEVTSGDGLELREVYHYNKNMFVALDNHGELIHICSNTLLTMHMDNSTKFKCFTYKTDPNNKSSHIFVVTENDEFGESYVQSYSYPDFSQLFSLKLHVKVYLIYPEHSQDECMYISEVYKQSELEELRFQVVLETNPENRLKRLLRRHKFEEAERFAKVFNLDLEEIQKAKAQVIVDKTVCSGTDITDLLTILETVDDVHFKLQCCFDVSNACKSWGDIHKILNFGCCNVPKPSALKETANLYEVLTEMMFRFDTFKLIQSLHKLDCEWSEFSENDLIDTLCTYLKQYAIEEAIIIYSRMDLTTRLKLNITDIEKILDILDVLELNVYKPFLYTFFPITLSYLPITLSVFVKWLTQRIFYIEQHSSYDEFPENAIEFTNSIVRLLKVDNIANLSFQQQCMLNNDVIGKLSDLVTGLKTMQILKKGYKISIPLKEYLKGFKSLITVLLTLDLENEVYDKFLRNFMCKFMLDHQLKPDDIFLEEISNITKYEENYWIKIVPSILKCISSVEVKLTAVIKIIEAADVPWCHTVRHIALASLDYKHYLVKIVTEKIKNEPVEVILRRPVYKLYNKSIIILEDFDFVTGRIMYCNEPTMVEDIYRLCENPEQKHFATIMLIDKFVRAGNFNEALKILDNNTPEEITKCCIGVITLITQSSGVDNYRLYKNYAVILKSIYRRWKENHIQTNMCQIGIEQSFQNIESYFKVKEHLYPDVNFDDIINLTQKKKLLETLLDHAVQEFYDSKLNIDESIKHCSRISLYLNEPKESVMIKYCEKLSNYDLMVEVANRMCATEIQPKNLCLMAVLLMKNVGLCNSSLECSSASLQESSESLHGSVTDLTTYLTGLTLARKLATKAAFKSDIADYNACMEVFKWTLSIYYITQDDDQLLEQTKCIFKNNYVEAVSPAFPTLSCVSFLFNTYSQFIISYGNSNMKYVTNFVEQSHHLSQEQFFKKLRQLPMILHNLCVEGHNLTAYELTKTLRNGLIDIPDINPEILKMLKNTIRQCVLQLLQKIFAAKHIDMEFAYSLFLFFDPEELFPILMKYLKLHKRDSNKLTAISHLGLRLSNYHKVDGNKPFFVNNILLVKWWKKIKNCKVPMKDFHVAVKDELATALIGFGHLTLEMIHEFCDDFKLHEQFYYTIYLNKLLVNWKPDCEQIDDVDGKKRLVLKNNEVELFEKCKEVLNIIEDKELLFNIINDFYKTINFYHYEVFICIFKILSFLNKNMDYSKKLSLLFFLKSYKRVKPPSNSEIEEWYTAFPDTQSIDSLAHWRLPFTVTLFTNDIWNIIRPEINLKTYTIWFKAVPILPKILNKNTICSYVVKDVVSSQILVQSVNTDWVFNPFHETLFEEIDTCVQNITKLEEATSAMYHLMTHTPNGADQVNAAKLCLKYAIQYKDNAPESDTGVLKAFTKVQKKYISFSANHILHMYQIFDANYVELISKPEKLIEALYTDDRILKRADGIVLNCPDINKAVDELGILFNIDIEEARHNLLENLLSDSGSSFNLDTTILSGKIFDNSDLEDAHANNIKRAAYICQSGNVLQWQKHLLKRGLESHVIRNFGYKANALKCFCAISDVSSIEKLTNTPYDAFLNFIDKLLLINDLETLGLSFESEDLDQYSKMDLLKRLSRDIYNPTAVKIMGEVCITYTIYDLRYWEIIINASIKLRLFVQLKKYVQFLEKDTKFTHKKFYIHAWQNIIDHAFIIFNKKEDLYNNCIQNILMIQSCPVLFSLNFENVFRLCCENKQSEFAAIFIKYFRQDDQRKYAKDVLKCNPDICSRIEELSQYGIWGTSHVIHLLENS